MLSLSVQHYEHVVRPVSKLVAYPRNARTHPETQIIQLTKAIKEFGWTSPCLIDEHDGLIAGHARVVCAQRLGIPEVPCIVVSGLSEAQKRALVISDNKIAINAGWNDELLIMELGDIASDGLVDIDAIGFERFEIDALLGLGKSAGLTDPDAAPEPPAIAVSMLADVWIMGRHRLVCGDSTDAATVAKALNGVQPHLMVTDPPYGVDYEASWRLKAMPEKNTIGGSHGKVWNDDRADWRAAWCLFSGDVAYIWHAGNKANLVADGLLACGMEIRAQLIWVKHQFVISRGHYHPHHEPCWYVVRHGSTGHWNGDRTQSTVWQIDKSFRSETGHSAQKPVECMKRPIENNSSPGQAVYEPFSGSFTTGIACEMTGRACHAIELNPAYVDCGVLRWQAFSGQTAILENDGRPFDQIAIARQSSLSKPQDDSTINQ